MPLESHRKAGGSQVLAGLFSPQSGDLIFRLLDFALFLRWPASTRQLQNRQVLAFAEIRDKHDLAIRKFQGVVVGSRSVEIDLPETRHFV